MSNSKPSNGLQQQLKILVSVLNRQMRGYYLLVLASDLEGESKSLQSSKRLFTQAETSLRESKSFRDFAKNIMKCLKKIASRYRMQSEYKQIGIDICRKLEQIKPKVGRQDFKQYFIDKINFDCPGYKSSKSSHRFKQLADLSQYLEGLKIDFNLDIKGQAHKYLSFPHNFLTQFQGVKKIKGEIIHKDKCIKQFNIPFLITVNFRRNLQYNKQIRIRGQKGYSGTVKVPKCSCGYHNFFSGWTLCQFCSHYPIEIPYQGIKDYQINQVHVGEIAYNKTDVIELKSKFTKIQEFEVKIPYQQQISYKNKHITECKDHHKCSCSILAEFALSVKEIYEKIDFYNQLIQSQDNLIGEIRLQGGNSWISRVQKYNINSELQKSHFTQSKNTNTLNNQTEQQITIGQQTPTPNQQQTPVVKGRLKQPKSSDYLEYMRTYKKWISSLEDNSILQKSINQKKMTQIIHAQLCRNYTFSVVHTNQNLIKIYKPYQALVHFSGVEKLSGSLQRSTDAYYSDARSYGGIVKYAGTVPVKICYDQCRVCNIQEVPKKYNGETTISHKEVCSGVLPFNEKKRWKQQIVYDDYVGVINTFERDILVEYTNQHDATCKGDAKIGSGHHSCTSCSLWGLLVTVLKQILLQKQQLSRKIDENKKLLTLYILQKKQEKNQI